MLQLHHVVCTSVVLMLKSWIDARADPKISMLGAMQALFEGAMYTFVFLWTPALSPAGEHIPHGMIFACFMVSSMVGSAIAGRLLSAKTCAAVLRMTPMPHIRCCITRA